VGLDVMSGNLSELIDIYRYTNETESLLSSAVARGDFST